MKKKWKMWSAGAVAVCLAAGLAPVAVHREHASPAAGYARDQVPSGQTITLWVWVGGPQLEQVKRIAANWAKIHGDQVNVVDQSKNPNGFQFYATAARTGKGPDVLIGMPHDNNGLFAEEGLIAPVPAGLINTKDYSKSVLDACTVQGKLYALPVSVETTALFYNKKLVKKPPTNWQSFVQAANRSGFMYDQANLYFDYAFIGGMGGYIFKNNHGTLDPNQIGLDTPGAIKGFQLMRDMVAKYKWMTPTTNGAVASAKFSAGKLGMYLSGPWDIPNMQAAKVPFGIAPLPTLPNGHHATPFMGVKTTIVNARSQTQAADWSLAEAISNRSAQLAYFNQAQQIPASLSLQKSVTVQSDAYFKAFATEIPYAVPMPNIPQMQAVWSAMSVISNIISGKVSPAQGAHDFVNNIKKGIAVQGS